MKNFLKSKKKNKYINWILKDFVNTTGSNAEILRWSRFYIEV